MPPANRKLFGRTSRFQKPILSIVGVTSLITFILALCVGYLCYDATTVVVDPAKDIPVLKVIVLVVLMVLPVIFYFIIVWSYKMSSQLVGSFERILRELDSILTGKDKRHIQTRKGDLLAEELLKRINALIDKVP